MRKRERTNDPGQTGLDRRRVLVKVLAVKTHASLEAQAIAGAEACELYGRF